MSEDKLDKVRAYIAGQEEHHQKITFLQEYNNFLKHFGFFKSQGQSPVKLVFLIPSLKAGVNFERAFV